MKKVGYVILVSLLVTLSILATVNAATPEEIQQQASETTKGFIAGIKGVIVPITDALYGQEQIFPKLFLAVLLFLLVYTVVEVFTESKAVVMTISAAVALISIFAIPPEMIQSITTSYGAMGAAILSILPFIIVLLFSIRVGSPIAARFIWIYFAIYYLLFYFYELFNSTTAIQTFSYIIALVVGILMFFVIGPVRNLIWKGKMDAIKEQGKRVVQSGKALHDLQKEELENSYGGGI